MLSLKQDEGLKEIDVLRNIYIESCDEIRQVILSKIKEIETSVSYGLIIIQESHLD